MTVTISMLTCGIENILALPKGSVTGTDKLVDFSMDSLDYLELVIWIEDLMGIELPDEELENLELEELRTVDDIHEQVNKLLDLRKY